MKAALPLRIPIESFVVTPDERDASRMRVLYFDPRGARHEVFFEKRVVDEAISKLDGRPRAIERSSGGVVAAQPCQLVIHHSISEGMSAPPELRIKVRFKDFARDEKGRVSGSVTTVTKNVLPHEILGEVSYDLKSSQKFLLDFGAGAIPIAIFSFVSDAAGENQALFVDADAIERAMRSPAGSRIHVQRYRVSKDLVRVVREHATEILTAARSNFDRLNAAPGGAIPEALKAGESLEIPTGLSYQELSEFLRQSAHRWNRQSTEEKTLSEIETRDEGCVTSDFLLFMEPV